MRGRTAKVLRRAATDRKNYRQLKRLWNKMPHNLKKELKK